MTSTETLAKARINFKSGVPDLLFEKVNGNCSVPRCKNPTTGPFKNLGAAVNMGVACHIFSASEAGPRGRGGKDAAFIESEGNGIWCCQYHASLIDKKSGIDYSAKELFAWKKLAEARVLKKMNDVPSPLGWVESIEYITLGQGASVTPKILLSRYTLITGRNGSGKTALLEAAATICNSKYFERLASTYTMKGNAKIGIRIEAKTTYTTVDTFSKELHTIADNFAIRRKDGRNPCLLPPGDIEVIYCSEDDAKKLDSEDDVDFFTRALNVDSSALREIIDLGPSQLIDGRLFLRDEMDEDEHGRSRPRCDDYGNQCVELVLSRVRYGQTIEVTYNCLSSSEKGSLLLALSITKAREVAKQKLTLLAIDSLAISFDPYNFEKLLRALQEEDFQVLVSLPSYQESLITEVVDGVQKLRQLDYLADWRLQTLQRSQSSISGPTVIAATIPQTPKSNL